MDNTTFDDVNKLRPLEHAIGAQFIVGLVALWFSAYWAILMLLVAAFAVYLYHVVRAKDPRP